VNEPLAGTVLPNPKAKAGVPALPNPNPANYEIVRSKEIGPFVILEIRYPDCTNYEGHKILVFDSGASLEKMKKAKRIDPHFCEDKRYSPIARFVPTLRGWEMAVNMCEEESKGYS
jgi:hypothetical protein